MSENMSLDKERLDELIQVLTAARTAGFESLSSPIDFLIDAWVDLCLLLADKYKSGVSGQTTNKSLKEGVIGRTTDQEGHESLTFGMITIKGKKTKSRFNPKIGKIFTRLASLGVRLKSQPGSELLFHLIQKQQRSLEQENRRILRASEKLNQTVVSDTKRQSSAVIAKRESFRRRRARKKRKD